MKYLRSYQETVVTNGFYSTFFSVYRIFTLELPLFCWIDLFVYYFLSITNKKCYNIRLKRWRRLDAWIFVFRILRWNYRYGVENVLIFIIKRVQQQNPSKTTKWSTQNFSYFCPEFRWKIIKCSLLWRHNVKHGELKWNWSKTTTFAINLNIEEYKRNMVKPPTSQDTYEAVP